MPALVPAERGTKQHGFSGVTPIPVCWRRQQSSFSLYSTTMTTLKRSLINAGDSLEVLRTCILSVEEPKSLTTQNNSFWGLRHLGNKTDSKWLVPKSQKSDPCDALPSPNSHACYLLTDSTYAHLSYYTNPSWQKSLHKFISLCKWKHHILQR